MNAAHFPGSASSRLPWTALAAAGLLLLAGDARGGLVRGTDEHGRVVWRQEEPRPAPPVVVPDLPAEDPGDAPGAGGLPIWTVGEVPFQKEIEEAARRHHVSADLVEAVMSVESAFNPFAVSSKGAIGLMQLLPETADRFGVGDIFDPRENIEGGVRYLSYLQSLFGGNTALVAAAYNAGENAVLGARGVPPYPETRQYVRKVLAYLGQAPPPSLRPAAEPDRKDHAVVTPALTGRTVIYRYVDASGTLHFTNQKPVGVSGVTVWKPAR